MMYEKLASFYDALVKDDEATWAWVKFVQKHMHGNKLLEAACGSGEITLALATCGYDITAGDISEDMMAHAQKKRGSELVKWQRFDMRDLSAFSLYDGILCFCDSLNYLLTQTDLITFFQAAYDHLHNDGVLLFDMHSLDRLSEFTSEYCEAGRVCGTNYEWSILSEDEYIYQNFAFYDEAGHVTLEQHVQRIYDPKWVETVLTKIGFHVNVYTDFDQEGICEGEKYFYVCKKETK